MFGTFAFIIAVGALSAFKIFLVMCSCYVEFKYLTGKSSDCFIREVS